MLMADEEPVASHIRPPEMGPFLELARAYVPPQVYSAVWSPAEGLQKGTIFPELYRPYVPRQHGWSPLKQGTEG